MSAPAATTEDPPRDRLFRRGATALGDEELLALLLGSGARDGNAPQVATALLKSAGGLAALSRGTPRELSIVKGVGTARAARVAAAFELGRRAVETVTHRKTICAAEDVYRIVAPRLAGLPQEVFLSVGLDIRQQLLDVVEVARGTVSGVEVHPREVFRPLVRMAASAGVVVHNHPSGDATPSHEDIELTRRLRQAGMLMGIPIIDHVVIGDQTYRSMAEWIGTEVEPAAM